MEQNQPIKTGVLDLLRNSVGSQYVIPVYQRNYTWTAKNEVKQLLQDLKAVLNQEHSKHFKGSKTALSTTASLLSGGSRNGLEWWLLNNGRPILDIIES